MVGSPDYSTTWGRAGQGRAGTSTAPCTVGWRRSAEAHPGRQASSLDIQDAGQGGFKACCWLSAQALALGFHLRTMEHPTQPNLCHRHACFFLWSTVHR